MGSFLAFPLAKPPEIFDLPDSKITCFSEYRRHWSEVVKKLQEKYPQWTSEDILNLRYQFEVFVRDQGYLLHFATFNEMLDVFQDATSLEQRRAMFDSVDTCQYNAINFEEYLQLMNNINIGTPVPRPPGIEDDRDEIMNLVSDLSEAHTFSQICYGLF
uniref:Si:ch211-122l24.6 n=1 Tax=Cyprinus carpio carpio TaxID=630221 RepID=A0A9J7X935_CYPCA